MRRSPQARLLSRTLTMTVTLTRTLTLTAGEAAEAVKLRVAVGWCCAQVDVLGRTPLHLAARCGQLVFVQWAITLLCTRPRAGAISEGGDISEG